MGNATEHAPEKQSFFIGFSILFEIALKNMTHERCSSDAATRSETKRANAPRGRKMATRRPQDGPKIRPSWLRKGSKEGRQKAKCGTKRLQVGQARPPRNPKLHFRGNSLAKRTHGAKGNNAKHGWEISGVFERI